MILVRNAVCGQARDKSKNLLYKEKIKVKQLDNMERRHKMILLYVILLMFVYWT